VTGGFRAEVDLLEGQALEAVASLWRKTGRQLRARFGGSSMRPALPPGTEVLLRCGEEGAPGDVIAFLAGGRLVVHRIVARAPDGSWTLTCGDARVLPDVPILDPDAILGRVAGLWRGASLEEVPAGRDSVPRRFVRGLFSAVLRASPRAGVAALRGLHMATRLMRTLALVLGRRRVRESDR
jgi:hypothetical protein